MRTTLLALAALAAVAGPAAADTTSGTILAYDRKANVLVFTDRSVWRLGDLAVPDDLVAGDRVTLDYTSAGDNGIGKANSLTRDE